MKTEASAARLYKLQEEMTKAGVGLTVMAPTSNMRYLLGFSPLADERFCALLVTRDETRLIIPDLNADQVEAHTGLAGIRWKDEAGPEQAIAEALEDLDAGRPVVLAADAAMRADTFLVLQEATQPGHSVSAADLMAELRIRKSERELEVLARAAVLADGVLMVGAEACRPGVTERGG